MNLSYGLGIDLGATHNPAWRATRGAVGGS
jgi:hypothetical protein